ncbi:MAG: hypothetical protein K9H15_03700 [Bacteroidales bacterium]|nr:hypothetical protein [Bacteroidales bacterium]
MGIHEKAKTIRETKTTIPDSINPDLESKVISDKLMTFNKEGFLIETKVYKDGQLYSTINYHYNDNNHPLGFSEFTANGSPYLKAEYVTDEKGYITEAVYDRSLQKGYDHRRTEIDVEFEKFFSNLFKRVIFKNDHKGRALEETYLKPDSSLAYKLIHRYDFRGNLKETKFYNSAGNLSWKKTFRYGKKGFVSEIRMFISNYLALTSTFTYQVDANENWTYRRENRRKEHNIYTTGLSEKKRITKRVITYY